MNRLLISFALITSPLLAQASTSVSISVGQPGFYGQLELGNMGPPPVLYAQPQIILPGPVAYPPLYLRVPSSHYRNWRHYCGRYHACDRPVYFVRDDWYRNSYVPGYRRDHGWSEERHEDRDQRHEDHRHEHHDERR